jgi:hypothetical protein
MSPSLLTSVLPNNSQFSNNLKLVELQKNEDRVLRLQIHELILKIAIDTAKAIINYKYKKFDALVKNFGCQITALEVFQIFKDNKLVLENEAASVKTVAKTRLSEIKVQQTNLKKRRTVKIPTLDIVVSTLFVKCMRFRLLCIVNDNRTFDKKKEIPYTDCTKIESLCNPPKKAFEKTISALQVEEAESAAAFIRKVSLNIDTKRSEFVKTMLNEINISNKISSQPLLYNTEAVLSAFNGLLLIKNKLSVCGIRNDREPVKVFLKLPGSQILDEIELDLRSKTPIIVIEGYINNRKVLIETINTIGLINIVNANCALEKQFAGCNENVKNKEAIADIAAYITLEEKLKIKETILDIDHFYAASLYEELGEAT